MNPSAAERSSDPRIFHELLSDRWADDRFVCVGLDVDVRELPAAVTGDDPAARCLRFASAIVDATYARAAAFKPNLSFFEALGPQGMPVLQQLIRHIHRVAPGVPVIADAKRADIASTNNGYVDALFGFLQADAVTLHPYLGHEALAPFLKQAHKGCFILCRTSNPGAGELQDLEVDGEPLFLRLAALVARDWNTERNCGLVAGATYPEELALIRRRVPDLPLLIPGIGAQGGSVERTVRSAMTDNRELRALINSSRGILYAKSEMEDKADFEERAAEATAALDAEIQGVVHHIRDQ